MLWIYTIRSPEVRSTHESTCTSGIIADPKLPPLIPGLFPGQVTVERSGTVGLLLRLVLPAGCGAEWLLTAAATAEVLAVVSD